MSSTFHRHDIAVHRLHIVNKDAIRAHFLRLDAPSRRARFCGTISDSGVMEYAENVFDYDSILCGAFIGRHLRGIVELRGVIAGWHSTAEAAFSVEQGWQNIGIGDALFDRIFDIARNRGVQSIHMMCLKENNRMKHLAQKHDAVLRYDADAIEAVVHPSWPTPVSMAREFIGETQGYARSLFG